MKPNKNKADLEIPANCIMSRLDLWMYIKARMEFGPHHNPFYYLVDVVGDEAIDPRVRVMAAQAVCDRLMPKLKQVEVVGDEKQPVKIKVSLQWQEQPPEN